MMKKIGADPVKMVGLQENLLERFKAALRKNDGTFFVQLEKFLKMSGKKRNEIFGIKDAFESKLLHPDYKLIKSGIMITAQERDRKAILGDTSQYYLGDNFREKFYNKLTSCKTDSETLSESELLKYKKDKEIISEMDITEISRDQIAERIIQFGKIDCWIIIGYSEGLVVYAALYDDGRVNVRADGLDDWIDGSRLLSRDIGA